MPPGLASMAAKDQPDRAGLAANLKTVSLPQLQNADRFSARIKAGATHKGVSIMLSLVMNDGTTVPADGILLPFGHTVAANNTRNDRGVLQLIYARSNRHVAELKAELQRLVHGATETLLRADGVAADMVATVRAALLGLPGQLLEPSAAYENAFGVVLWLPSAQQDGGIAKKFAFAVAPDRRGRLPPSPATSPNSRLGQYTAPGVQTRGEALH